ncbi:MAG TPA: hypothetical protein VNF05_08495 [Acidimicrobiales bacterium]|nr:hypothetical protein [Acidimicrobiales bacterium]
MAPDDFTNTPERLVLLQRKPGMIGKAARFGLMLLGLEIPPDVPIGPGFRLPHGAVGLVIQGNSVIGSNVTMFGGVVLGRGDQHRHDTARGGRIIVGDGVRIGSGAKVMFKSGETLTLGEGCVIGANAVVLSSVPAGEIWAGSPAVKVGIV